jgi:HlyD family secretion protein
MTANLTITIDERNNVLKVPNAALRFTPQDTSGQRSAGNFNGQTRRQRSADQGNSNANGADSQFAPPSAPVLAGQTRIVWVMGKSGPERRRIKVGLTDGISTEVLEGNLVEGELVITGQTLSSASKSNTNQSSAPGFGGAPRTGGAPRGGGR